MSVWYVGHNIPGALPDDPPIAYDTWEQAASVLAHMIDTEFAVYRATHPGFAYHEEYEAARVAVSTAPEGVPYALFYMDRVWWIADL